ncbi:MAG: J domain-containing protein [Spirochaetales bacterium]
MTATITPRVAQKALKIIFGSPGSTEPDFSVLAVLDQRTLAARFRSRALELHPDRAQALGVSAERLELEFKRLHGAYRVLGRLIEDEPLRLALLRSVAGPRVELRRGGDVSASEPSAEGEAQTLWTPATRTSARIIDPSELPEADLGNDDVQRRFFSGRVPTNELRFAQFLYYHRVIDWKTMIDAVTWQFRVRPKVGEIGRSYRFIDFKGVNMVLKSSPRGELFGTTAIRIGVLDPRQLRVMLGKQHQLNYPIGRFFTDHEILSKDEVERLLSLNKRHNRHYRECRDE